MPRERDHYVLPVAVTIAKSSGRRASHEQTGETVFIEPAGVASRARNVPFSRARKTGNPAHPRALECRVGRIARHWHCIEK